MRIVAISDIHGHYDEMAEALNSCGFRKNDPGQLLVVCGDCFDRGDQNLDVFRYLSSVGNKVIVRGNHEDLLLGVFREKTLDAADIYNGVDATLFEFLRNADGSFMGHGEVNRAVYGLYIPFLESTVDCFETENYIFVHGWLPFEYGKDGKPVLTDYRSATEEQWITARWTSWQEAVGNGLIYGGKKKIVCGHYATRAGCLLDKKRDPADSGVFRYSNFIAIDANVMSSGKINALVLEDGLLQDDG